MATSLKSVIESVYPDSVLPTSNYAQDRFPLQQQAVAEHPLYGLIFFLVVTLFPAAAGKYSIQEIAHHHYAGTHNRECKRIKSLFSPPQIPFRMVPVS